MTLPPLTLEEARNLIVEIQPEVTRLYTDLVKQIKDRGIVDKIDALATDDEKNLYARKEMARIGLVAGLLVSSLIEEFLAAPPPIDGIFTVTLGDFVEFVEASKQSNPETQDEESQEVINSLIEVLKHKNDPPS